MHKYGPHIFHTDNKEIWDFVNSLVPFNRYVNHPVANYQGNVFNLPFNMNTFHQMWGVTTPAEALAKLEEQKAEAQAALLESGVPEPRNLEEQAILLVGREIYEKLVKGYSEKQWGRPCPDLPAYLIKRLPVRLEYDNNYYNDSYQGIPIGGYNNLIEKLLEGIECQVDVDFLANRTYWMSLTGKVVYSGPLDAFYDYRFGQLEWRTLRYEQEVLDIANYQGNAVVNFTDRDVPYTRIIEHKHFESFGSSVYDNPHTVISREYSMEWVPGMDPFYPVNDERNTRLYGQYKTLADQEGKVLFGGRLAEYKYYDMAPVMERAREVFLMEMKKSV